MRPRLGRWRVAGGRAGRLLGAVALLACASRAAAQGFDPFDTLAAETPVIRLKGDEGVDIPSCPADEAEGGQPVSEVELTLGQAVLRALCNNPAVRQSWAGARAQSALVGQARSALLPTLAVGLTHSRDITDTENTLGTGYSRNDIRSDGKTLSFNWLLFDYGARFASIDQAEQSVRAALASHDGALQSTAMAAVQAWYDALAAQASVRAGEQAEAVADETLKAAQARLTAGAVLAVDVLQARTARSQATLNRVRAGGNEQVARAALARAMGADLRIPLRLPSASDPIDDPRTLRDDLSGSPSELIGDALARHPAVAAALSQLAAAESRLAALKAEGLPTLSFSFGNYLNGRPGTAITSARSRERLATLTFSWPLFDGFNRSYREQEQRATIASRRADVAAAESQVAYDAWRAWQTLQVEAASVAASADLVKSASESLQAARARQRAGAIDIIELLNVQRDAANAQQERIQAVANWRTARLRLLGSLGRLGFWALSDH